ncbi:MAG: hypothetical protein ACRYGP_10920 [Janthinobacterium lividum]
MKLAGPLGLVLSIATTMPCLAGAMDVSADLRQRAIQTCQGDAVRLCPEALTDEGAAVSCMAAKRPQLSPSCRVVYDQVARILKE